MGKNNGEITIEKECLSDYDEIDDMARRAAASNQDLTGHEHELIRVLRKSDAYIPHLALVAKYEGKIIGHIMMINAMVGDCNAVMLASITATQQKGKRGALRNLMIAAHAIAHNSNYDVSLAVGSRSDYDQFGYIDATEHLISADSRIPSRQLFAVKLGVRDIEGKLTIPDEMFEYIVSNYSRVQKCSDKG